MVLQCRKTLGDVTSTTQTAKSGAEEESLLTYLDISTSSKPTSTQEENKENALPPPSAPQSEHPAPGSRAALHLQEQSSSLQVLATPTLVMSQGGETRWSVSSLEETPTNPNRTLIQSPGPSAPPTARKVEDAGVETRTRTDPADSSLFAPPTSSSSPMSGRLRPQADDGSCQTGEDEAESISLQRCQQVADELRQATHRAVLLYRQQASGSERCAESSSVLQEAFATVHGELQAVMQPLCSSAPSGQTQDYQTQDDQTASLLEKYSELLVQMTRNKLNKI